MIDEHDQTMKLNDPKDWPLKNKSKIVSDFLDPMPCNLRDTKPKTGTRASSPSSVSSSRMSSFFETSIQIYQAQDQQLESLEQQMDEILVLLAQSQLRRENFLEHKCSR